MFKGPFPSSSQSFPLLNEVQLSPFHLNYCGRLRHPPFRQHAGGTAAAVLPLHWHSAAAVTQQDSLHCSAGSETLKGVCFSQSCWQWGFKGYWQWQWKMWDGEGRVSSKGLLTLIAMIKTRRPARKKRTYTKPECLQQRLNKPFFHAQISTNTPGVRGVTGEKPMNIRVLNKHVFLPLGVNTWATKHCWHKIAK